MLDTLRQLGVTPDFVVYHRYEQGPGGESDLFLLNSAASWANDAAALRQMLDDYLGPKARHVELAVTEHNSVFSNPGKQTTSLVNGLFYADAIGNLLKTEFNAMLWWDLRNGQEAGNNNSSSLYGWRRYGDYGIVNAADPGGPRRPLPDVLREQTTQVLRARRREGGAGQQRLPQPRRLCGDAARTGRCASWSSTSIRPRR